MSFMEPDVYAGTAYRVETSQGDWIVPEEVCGNLDKLSPRDRLDAVRDYVEPTLEGDEPITREKGWLARMSAPGYLDCTEWAILPTEKEALDYLDEYYGPFGDESDDDEAEA